MFNYNKLYAKLRERRCSQRALAQLVGMSESTMSYKLVGKGEFRDKEISAICDALDISTDDIGAYFFTEY